jgi:hypothetical protein
MKDSYGIENNFQMDLSLSNLLTSLRYQKIGYIPEHILGVFRDFCSLLFYVDVRDRFSLALRHYAKHLQKDKQNKNEEEEEDGDDDDEENNNIEQRIEQCLKIVDYGNMMLSFRSLFTIYNRNQSEFEDTLSHIQVQDIVLSTIARLTSILNNYNVSKNMLRLEKRLAKCVDKRPYAAILNESLNRHHTQHR